MDAARARSRDEDRELAHRAASGERTAQRELFHAQRRGVHHALYRVLGANRELEDLLQDAFVTIFRALPSFRGESSLDRWCQTIAMRTAFLALRRKKLTPVELDTIEEVLAGHDDLPAEAHTREAMRRLYLALDRLDPKQRIAFALFAIDGRAMEEVAELTDTTKFAAKTRVWRARRELRARAAKDPVLSTYLEELVP